MKPWWELWCEALRSTQARRQPAVFCNAGAGSQVQVACPAGKVLLKAHVEEVLVEGGRAAGVRLKDGSTIRAHTVVSPALSLNSARPC